MVCEVSDTPGLRFDAVLSNDQPYIWSAFKHCPGNLRSIRPMLEQIFSSIIYLDHHGVLVAVAVKTPSESTAIHLVRQLLCSVTRSAEQCSTLRNLID